GDGRIEQHEALAWDDEHQDGRGFKEWEPFEHPQLGTVEIGGWRKFGQNNPLPEDLPREVERNVDFVLMQAAHTPQLEIAEATLTALGGGVHRLEVEVGNLGFAPTELAIRRQLGRAVPVRVAVGGEGVEVLSSEAEIDLGTLVGHDTAEAEWVLRAASGATVRIEASHPKAGRAEHTLTVASD
ncbi:MAG: hypothetical protein R3244_09335, partial [Thermoanaerobaculia bacterium]|nr:hypothetical protein [Thermoanaerobaculia bacterium]